ncbi:MAG: hypothetical protein ABFS22_01160 [Pseudomonadota bacterium]
MTRAIGFLVGALLMSGVFLLALSTGNSPTLVKEVVSSEADTDRRVTEPAPAEDVPVDNAVDSPVLPVTDTASPAEESKPDATGNELALDPQSWNQSVAAQETDDRSGDMAGSRYRVWSPFRSEWAANGFARRLALATDVPMEVVNESPGNYQVVFSYRDDGERQVLVEHIQTITGLELE